MMNVCQPHIGFATKQMMKEFKVDRVSVASLPNTKRLPTCDVCKKVRPNHKYREKKGTFNYRNKAKFVVKLDIFPLFLFGEKGLP